MNESMKNNGRLTARQTDSAVVRHGGIVCPETDDEKLEPGGLGRAQTQVDPTSADDLSEDDLKQMRHEKIAAIRSAIEAGAYDSEELLETAMMRMMQQLNRDSESAHERYSDNV